ncbi:YVTN beta-propeller repeat-containing protein, partial [mine drainage metagenome]
GDTVPPAPARPADSTARGLPGSNATTPGPEYRVAETLVLPNDSLRPGTFAASNGLGPEALVFDSGKGELFVANTVSNSITVLNDTTGAIVGSVAVGPEPASLAYDPSLGTIYVANGSYASVATGQSSIWAFNDTTYQGTAIPTGAEPNAVAYDPTNEEVFVANSGANTVTVINATNNTPTATIAVPSSAWGIAYDPWLNEVVVALTEADRVALIDAGNLTLRADPHGRPGLRTSRRP